MPWKRVALLLGISLATLLLLFNGIERVYREHGVVEYGFFVKQWPGFKVVYENSAKCGECDVRPWNLMTSEDQSSFARYCSVRFGLDDVRLCYALFEAQERLVGGQCQPNGQQP